MYHPKQPRGVASSVNEEGFFQMTSQSQHQWTGLFQCDISNWQERICSKDRALKRTFPITGGSSCEPLAKKLRTEYERNVSHIGVRSPITRTTWSHVPITFTQSDFRLRDYPHNDAMVITCNIGGYMCTMSLSITKVLQTS